MLLQQLARPSQLKCLLQRPPVPGDLTESQECNGILLHVIAQHAALNGYAHLWQDFIDVLPPCPSVCLPLHWVAARQTLETSALVASVPFFVRRAAHSDGHLKTSTYIQSQPCRATLFARSQMGGGPTFVTEKYSTLLANQQVPWSNLPCNEKVVVREVNLTRREHVWLQRGARCTCTVPLASAQ